MNDLSHPKIPKADPDTLSLLDDLEFWCAHHRLLAQAGKVALGCPTEAKLIASVAMDKATEYQLERSA